MKNKFKSSTTEEFRKIGQIIEDARIGMLTTHNQAGGLCSRPMYTQEIDANGSLWFFTSVNSHIVSEIRGNHNVQITFCSRKNNFVSASAIAYEVLDRAHMHSLWTTTMKAWFPQGLDSADLVLLRLELEDVEYWDTSSSPEHHEKINLNH